MKIAGLVKTSLIDYPGKVSAVIFTQGCNFRCGFCHNPELVIGRGEDLMDEDEVFSFLNKRVTQLDGVVITGGEPTILPDLYEFTKKIKKLGYSVKLDTNGSNPALLRKLLDEKLIDYVAMDIKGPLASYSNICGLTNTKVIQESIKLLLDSVIDHEFRTTFLPAFHRIEDAGMIGELIKGGQLFSVQGFRPGKTLDPKCSDEATFTYEELSKIAQTIRKYVGNVRILDNIT